MSEPLTETKIPSLFSHNHASNLLSLSNGDLFCVWFGGSREGKSDISVLCSRLEKGSSSWSEPEVLSGDPKRSEQNPVLFEHPDGALWLLYTAQHSIHQDSAVVRCRISNDHGRTWKQEQTLFDTPGSFVRNPPVIRDNGEIILPAYYSIKSENGFLGKDYSVVKISGDAGQTWEEYPVDDSEALVHMSIVKGGGNELIGFFRSRKADYIHVTTSNDHGRTWTTPEKTTLMNNNASIQCQRLQTGNLAIVFNNINAELAPPEVNSPPWFDDKDQQTIASGQSGKQESIWGVIRAPLAIAVSEDDGRTWPHYKEIAVQQNDQASPEFSYPSIHQTKDGAIHMTYTYLRECIKHTVVTEDWIKS
ncbi:sialidase family protein [Salibacterium lacus]|uniref:Exo-alpha-sialidase n=1 Tax=Salibacterium lacus TaxID=1898109 RepID=A0ABW5T3H2_9BACI